MPTARHGRGNREPGGWARGHLGETDTTALHELCRTHGVTPFMVLMATLATVLARWSGQRDLIIGVPIAGRTDAGTETLIGFLVNTLPIRIELTGDPTFTDLLTRVRQVCLDGYAHSDAPLDVLVQQLDITRDPRHTPLFQVVLSMLSTSSATPKLPGITVEPVDAPPAQPTKLDLTLNVQESGHRMQFQLDFNPERYDRAMIQALIGHLETLLHAAISDPDRGILDYQLDPGPAGHTYHIPDPEPAAERPAPAPGHPAVVTPGGTHTYNWLARTTAAITSQLPATEPISLIRRPTATFVAAVLSRLHHQAPCTITGDSPDQPPGTMTVDVTSLTGLPSPASPGTTEPYDASPLRRHAWAADRCQLTPHDHITALTHHPDHLIAAITNTFTAGATFYIPPDYTTTDISTWLRDTAITVAFLSLPQLRSLTGPVPALHTALIYHHGDLLPHDITTLRRHAPHCQPVGIYHLDHHGQPLATYPIPRNWQPATAPLRIPLGTELPGHPAHLAHPGRQPAATGEVAELHTSTGPTGDLARRWTDGTLEYVGHTGTNPAQDPIQTLSALRDLPDVTDALITQHTTPDGHPTLIGYIAGNGPSRDGAAVRQDIMLRLPDYLTPQQLFVLGSLPRTALGDYDLETLPDGSRGTTAQPVPPRTPYEEVVHGVWADVLGLSDFGVHDDFFELGGHSLLAPRIMTRIRETFGVQIPVREFFGCRTVSALAAVVAAQSSAPSQVIERRPPQAESVLSFDQQRIWLENQLLPSLAYNVHGRQRLLGPLDVPIFEASVRAILTRHEALRTRFPVVAEARPGHRRHQRPLAPGLPRPDPPRHPGRAGQPAGRRAGQHTIRPGYRPPAALPAHQNQRHRAHPEPDRPPHRLRRLVRRPVRPRTVRPLRSRRRPPPRRTRATADPVPRLRRLAT